MIAQGRCLVDVGDPQSPLAVLPKIEGCVVDGKVISLPSRDKIVRYLTRQGVDLGRSMPRGWFFWLDEHLKGVGAREFAARCCDPGDVGRRDDGRQPVDFYVSARIDRYDRRTGFWRGTGFSFHHHTEFRVN